MSVFAEAGPEDRPPARRAESGEVPESTEEERIAAAVAAALAQHRRRRRLRLPRLTEKQIRWLADVAMVFTMVAMCVVLVLFGMLIEHQADLIPFTE